MLTNIKHQDTRKYLQMGATIKKSILVQYCLESSPEAKREAIEREKDFARFDRKISQDMSVWLKEFDEPKER